MCLALPMKVKKVKYPAACCEAAGVEQEIRVDFVENVHPGDYVMVHAGFAIQKMTEAEALENLELLKEIEDAL